MDKRKIIFACQWNRNTKKTWSGTSYSLYNSLLNYYQLENFLIKETYYHKIYRNICKHMGLSSFRNFSVNTIKVNNKKFNKKYKDSKIEVFQFSECPNGNNIKNNIYIDLSVSYLDYLKNHDLEGFNYSEFDTIPDRIFDKRKSMQNLFFEGCSTIFTMSKWLADYLVKYENIDQNKVFCVGAGINVEIDRKKDIIKTNNKILFIGRNFTRKGGFLVYDAFVYLKEHLQIDAELYIVGPPTNPVPYMVEGIYYMGDLSGNELTELYNTCDILCVPSYFEAYGLVFSEALCYGLPCIGRDAYAMPERIENGVTGYLLKEDNMILLAELMKDLLGNEKIKNEVSLREQVYLKEYSWDTVAEKIAAIMK